MVRTTGAVVAVVTLALAGAAASAPRGRAPAPATRPHIDGVPELGAPLTARSGTWKGARPLKITYRWQRCATTRHRCAVLVAVGPSYTPRPADVGRKLRLLVRVVNGAGAATATSKTVGPVSTPPVVDAAGDIACDPASAQFHSGAGTAQNCNEKATSDLLVADNPTVVLPLGDDQYECGLASAFQASYAPTWGRLKAVTRPAIGNHEYGRACSRDDPTDYFDYFGDAAGPRDKGWYSYDVGTWHMIALNSECTYGKGATKVGGCGPGSPEETWLRNDLATHTNECTLAYWHEPRFSSGEHGDAQQMATIWNDLVAAHADVVLSGHNHDYERFDPIGATPASTNRFQTPNLDPNGIREFVVGTGGRNWYPFAAAAFPGEAVRNGQTFGVLKLTLRAGSYDWQFEPVAGETFTDSGTGVCH